MRRQLIPIFVLGCASPGTPPAAPGLAARAVEPAAVWQWDGDGAEQMGLEVVGLGDVDGDGWRDWAVATEEAGDNGQGHIAVFHGGTSWPTAPALRLEGRSNNELGQALNAGDVNGDGFADLLVGYRPDNGGGASVFTGSAGGLTAEPAFTLSSSSWSDGIGEQVLSGVDFDADGLDDMVLTERFNDRVIVMMGAPTLPGPSQVLQPGGAFGSGVVGGDVNGDGFDDLVVGNSYLWDAWLTTPAEPARATVFLGGAAGLGPVPDQTIDSPQAEPEWFASQQALAVGDLNGDGFDDLAVGAPRYDEERGRLQVHLGGAGGLDPTAVLELVGDQVDGQLGRVVEIGDLDGDGFDDLILGLPHYDWFHGQVRIHAGGPAGPSATATMVLPGIPGSSFGHALATPGDLDGDGLGELIVGAPDLNSGIGRAYLFAGAALPPPVDTGDTGTPLDTGTTDTDTPPTDTASPTVADTSDTGTPADPSDESPGSGGCGCSSSGGLGGALWAAPLLGMLALRRRGAWALVLSLAACTPPDDPKDDSDAPDTSVVDTDDTDTGTTDTDTGTPDTGTTLVTWDWTGVDTQARFDGWVAWLEQQMVEQHLPGVQVAVAIGGQVVHAAALGVTDARTTDPVTDDTRFVYASTSKTFLAALTYDLAEEGLLDLDAPVTDYASDFVLAPTFDPSSITTRMALNHTSGLPDYLDKGCEPEWNSYAEFWSSLRFPLITPPGLAYNYSNTNYTLVANVVEAASGKRLPELMAERLTDPLGLSITYDVDQVVQGSHTAGHSPEVTFGDPIVRVEDEDWECLAGEGAIGLFGTAADAATLVAAVAGPQGPLEPASLREMYAGVPTGCTTTYGAGLFGMDVHEQGITFAYHGGWLQGHQSSVILVPEADLVISVMLHQDVFPPDTLAAEGVYRMLDLTPVPLDRSTPPSEWTAYAQEYVNVDGHADPMAGDAPYGGSWLRTSFTVQDDTLLGSYDDTDPEPMDQAAGDCFVHPALGLVVFHRDPNDEVTWLISQRTTGLVSDEVQTWLAPAPSRAPVPALPPARMLLPPSLTGWSER